MIMVPGETIEVVDLAFLGVSAPAHLRPVVPAATEPLGSLYTARDAWERDYIRAALEACDGNISKTADLLGVERSNLYRKMKGLGVDPNEAMGQ
jgi:two-component system nitrogen regulation response regulator NtrX